MRDSREEERQRRLDSLPILLWSLVGAAESGDGLTSLECREILNRWNRAWKANKNDE